MRVPVPAAGAATVLSLLSVEAVIWITEAFETVPIRWDPSIGNSCRAVAPETMADLRRAAAVPLILTALCSVGLAVLAGTTILRDDEETRPDRAVQVALAISTIVGGVLLWWSYAIGSAFEVAGALFVGAITLLFIATPLGTSRSIAKTWNGLGRPLSLAAMQFLGVPAIVMAATYTSEIPIC